MITPLLEITDLFAGKDILDPTLTANLVLYIIPRDQITYKIFETVCETITSPTSHADFYYFRASWLPSVVSWCLHWGAKTDETDPIAPPPSPENVIASMLKLIALYVQAQETSKSQKVAISSNFLYDAC